MSFLVYPLGGARIVGFVVKKQNKTQEYKKVKTQLSGPPSHSHRQQDGQVGSDDDEGRKSEAQCQDEENVDSVSQRGPHSPPRHSDTDRLVTTWHGFC